MGDAAQEIRVRVKALGHLRRYMPDARETAELEVPVGSSIREVLALVGIPRNEVWLVSIEDQVVEEDTTLYECAEILVMAPVEGG